MGFLPQAWLIAARTLRRTASLTSAWSLRLGLGMLSMVPIAASRAIVAKGMPWASAAGSPVKATSGSASTMCTWYCPTPGSTLNGRATAVTETLAWVFQAV